MQNVLPLPLRRRRGHEPIPASAPAPALSPALAAPAVPVAPVALDLPVPVVAQPSAVARVDGVELRPLASIALHCALAATIVAAFGATLLWMLVTATGVVQRTESFMESIGFRNFHVSAPQVIVGTVLVVAGLALVIATAVVVMGAAYNAFALNGHGLRVRVGAVDTTNEPVVAGAPTAQWTNGRDDPAA